MTQTEPEAPEGAPEPDLPSPDLPSADLAAYAQDLITLWQSELSALSADREMQEGFQRGLAVWGAMAQNFAQNLPHGTDFTPDFTKASAHETPRRPRPAAPPRPQADPAAPDARDAELARLAERVAELERRLAEIAGTNDDGGKPEPDQ